MGRQKVLGVPLEIPDGEELRVSYLFEALVGEIALLIECQVLLREE